ncbi:alpha/beta fold hydrolase [Methylobacter tundripaludum]|uniref:Pimeloyl-[acyl-carrier protein] methyl ester esterase n=1 Tax=Methylobacter tundripaludum (strain ATCC BAA-1195 / DSM 17260 / SV96) TaxID=697282 RepID=G3ITG5_METTV|nr:alpha/beta fold hydrolase [Methylobacter tundripaludum]EGW21375.1 Carboxylesterase [Methylobacter tundripaludum SV96]
MTKIHLETFGKGKPIVLVHGWAMHTGIWREFAKQLAQNYRVTCIDLPGHGRSEKIDPFTLERISDELVNIIPPSPSFSKGGNEYASCPREGNGQTSLFKKGAGGICWLGWSLGATVVLDIADRYPERVSSLVLLAGNPSYTQTEQWPGMDTGLLDDFAGHLNKNCQATLLRFLSLQVNGLPDRKILLKTLKESVFECDAPDKNTLQGGLKILKEADLRPVLSGLTIPVSAILGGLDTLVPVAVGQKMQQLLPSLELNVIDRAGHVPFLSHSRETLAIISRFMDEQCI